MKRRGRPVKKTNNTIKPITSEQPKPIETTTHSEDSPKINFANLNTTTTSQQPEDGSDSNETPSVRRSARIQMRRDAASSPGRFPEA